MSKYIGTTKIELTNTVTGEKKSYEKHNLVTNALADIVGKNPFGMVGFNGLYPYQITNSTSLYPVKNLICGLAIFDESIEENADSYGYPKTPMAWAGDNVNSTGGINRGSYNIVESQELEDGYKFVWDFATSQANGTIKTLALTSPIAVRSDTFFTPGSDPRGQADPALCKRVCAYQYQNDYNFDAMLSLNENSTEISENMQCLQSVYDGKKYMYRVWIESSGDDFQQRTMHVRRAVRYSDKIGLHQTNKYIEPGGVADIKGQFQGKYIEKYEDKLINEFESVYVARGTNDLTSTNTTIIISFSLVGNTLYVINTTNGADYYYVTKIDVSTWDSIEGLQYTNNRMALNGKKVFSQIHYGHNQAYGNGYARYMVSRPDTAPIVDGYVYFTDYDDNTTMFGVNLEDSTDIVQLESSCTTKIYNDYPAVYSGKLFYKVTYDDIGNYDANAKNGILVDTTSKTVTPTTKIHAGNIQHIYVGGYGYSVLNDFTSTWSVGPYVVVSQLLENSMTYYGDNHFPNKYPYMVDQCLCLNPLYLATINNVSPVTKTGDMTMKVTYTIREVEE